MQRIKVTNHSDLVAVSLGVTRPEDVRSIEIDALVDTGATHLILPEDVVSRLGLADLEWSEARLADGKLIPTRRVGGVRLDLLGRDTITTAYVFPAGTMPLIGQIPLEDLDFVVNPRDQSLMPNPQHPRGRAIDVLSGAF